MNEGILAISIEPLAQLLLQFAAQLLHNELFDITRIWLSRVSKQNKS
jgi:hypothetical protein